MKNLIYALITFSLINFTIEAQPFKTENFDTAKKDKQYLKFTGTSTKFGFVSTDFDGYAKEFNTAFTTENQGGKKILSTIKVEIQAASLDTDNSSRDEKLHTKCLNTETYKTIIAELNEKVELKETTEQKTNLKLTIRNNTISIPAIYSIKQLPEGYEISFTTQFSFKDVEIPDPSIAIAKLQDVIKLSGKLLLKN